MRDAWTLYVAELEPIRDEQAKWYVGITRDPDRRYREHRNGCGAIWTARNECVDVHFLGEIRTERYARESENQLTLALWDEYGPNTTQGGKYTGGGATSEPVPEETNCNLDPTVAEWLGETDNEELAALSDRGQLYVEVCDKISFESMDDIEEWTDRNLPEGTTIRVTSPEHRYGTFTAEKPGEESEPTPDQEHR